LAMWRVTCSEIRDLRESFHHLGQERENLKTVFAPSTICE
jgi:hypothetical protein